MRNEIRQILQDYQSLFGEEIFEYPAEFNARRLDAFPDILTKPIQNLVNIAIGRMDVYSRLKNSTSRNMSTDVYNLARELRKKYFIEENAAKMIIECIAELLGYTAPNDVEQIVPTIAAPAVGDIIKFGDYNWRVLDIKNGMALLLSENITEQRAYHPCYAGVTWEHSELRKYLNGDFYSLFDTADKEKIAETKISNPDNIWYNIAGGNDTFDKIFILNLEEADRYFGNSGDYLNKIRKKYDNGKWIVDNDGWIFSNTHDISRIAKHNGLASFWWLRSPGYNNCTVAYVSTTGNIPPNGDRICIGRGGIRPALWVKL